jgi:hypothetical protein
MGAALKSDGAEAASAPDASNFKNNAASGDVTPTTEAQAAAEVDKTTVHEGTAALLAMDNAASENILAHLNFTVSGTTSSRLLAYFT